MKIYVVRHFVEANSLKGAIKASQKRQPDDVYIADEWFNKVGFMGTTDRPIEGFSKIKK